MNSKTHYGIYGGQYVAETLMTPLAELEKAYFEAKKDPAFQAEFDDLMKHYHLDASSIAQTIKDFVK